MLPQPNSGRNAQRPRPAFPLVRAPFRTCTPDRIRTGATAVRERLRGCRTTLEIGESAGQNRNGRSGVVGHLRLSISGFLSGKVDLSDDQLDRLLSCMGFRLEVVRRPVVPQLTRSERRSWQLHRRLSTLLNHLSLKEWRPTLERNLDRLRDRVTGQPHERNVDRWRELIDLGDLPGLHRVLTGLDRDSIEMREVSPMGGLLTREQRDEVMAVAG